MARVPDGDEQLSLRLSEVLSDIGINTETITKRRNGALFTEAIFNVDNIINDRHVTTYKFGSMIEGSTTKGLNSDVDLLHSKDNYYVIHDLANWKYGACNLLMVQDESTAPGYCLLQRLRSDAPLALNEVPKAVFFKDLKGRVVLINSMFDDDFRAEGLERHGPAAYVPVPTGMNEREGDIVQAFCCSQWPTEGMRWLKTESRSGWPSAQLKSECASTGCFLVPVGSKIRGLDELEWRISTSLAERYLMFSLNMTQIRCYVLMKLLLKTYQVFHDVISSYMCKTALFHCIESCELIVWEEHNLIHCLNQVLHVLFNFIDQMNCPHFIIPENNLMAGRISAEQQHNLLATIQELIHSNGRALFDVHIDNLRERLQMKLNRIIFYRNIKSAVEIQKWIASEVCLSAFGNIVICDTSFKCRNSNPSILETLKLHMDGYNRCQQRLSNCTQLEEIRACRYRSACLSSTIGSLVASYCISVNKSLSDMEISCLMHILICGINSDVSSGLLKLATVCYSMGYINATENILQCVDRKYDRNVVFQFCGCCTGEHMLTKQGFNNAAAHIHVTDARRIISFCVSFVSGEINIVPQELRQEYHRSLPEESPHRNSDNDWMDLAVIDSLPYLYFLQYKTYGRLGKHREQQRAQHELQQVINNELTLNHKETSLNVLGLCLEAEHRQNEAIVCYKKSLRVREKDNAANFHLSRLLRRMVLSRIFCKYPMRMLRLIKWAIIMFKTIRFCMNGAQLIREWLIMFGSDAEYLTQETCKIEFNIESDSKR